VLTPWLLRDFSRRRAFSSDRHEASNPTPAPPYSLMPAGTCLGFAHAGLSCRLRTLGSSLYDRLTFACHYRLSLSGSPVSPRWPPIAVVSIFFVTFQVCLVIAVWSVTKGLTCLYFATVVCSDYGLRILGTASGPVGVRARKDPRAYSLSGNKSSRNAAPPRVYNLSMATTIAQ